jgi:hypothetical protein
MSQEEDNLPEADASRRPVEGYVAKHRCALDGYVKGAFP